MNDPTSFVESLPLMQRLGNYHSLLPPMATLAVVLVIAIVVHFIAKAILLHAAHVIAARTSVTWDDEIASHNVLGRLVQVLPALILFVGIGFTPDLPDKLAQLLRQVTLGYIILMLTAAVTAALSAANAIYSRQEVAKQRPLKGFVQLIQIALWLLATILIVATLIDRSPLLLLSGFGAMTAIVLLVFRDTILSLVASIQLSAQDIVRVGDWIEMPQFGADGDVIDMQLHTIKVQNWDKTITTIPTYSMIDGAFKNWRGMQQSGARRIKRSLHIDVTSIRFQTSDEIERFKRFSLLKNYLQAKERELAEYNAALEHAVDESVNMRRLTNIGTFRAYALNYLGNHPHVDKSMTLMVRQLPPEPDGLPMEIYCFANTTEWVKYEGIQADIFDHLLAIVAEFGLRVYQQPGGADLRALSLSSTPDPDASKTPAKSH